MDFKTVFERATEHAPFPYQKELAEKRDIPELLRMPTGSGKTAAAVLSWVWRRRFAPKDVRSRTPRMLVYCLPMRVLVEQTYAETIKWLDNLGLLAGKVEWNNGELERYVPDPSQKKLPEGLAKSAGIGGPPISVHLLMGGEVDGGWDAHPERAMILIGTQDMLLSRALNRGYSMSRFRWPVQYGLLNNNALWVMDEVQLMGAGLPTSAQLDAFREEFGTFGNCETVWMSATCEPEWLETVDRSRPGVDRVLSLSDEDRNQEELKKRVEASKSLHKGEFSLESTSKSGISEYIECLSNEVLERHKEADGENPPLTLVIVNTVERANRLYRNLREKIPDKEDLLSREQELVKKVENPESWGEVRKNGELYKSTQKKLDSYRDELEEVKQKLSRNLPELILVHSRFRPVEREKLVESIGQNPSDQNFPENGKIIVSTQVVEAGVDISASTMITELAPWTSIVQRFGRLNRYGELQGSEAVWIDISTEGRTSESNALPYTPEEMDFARNILKEMGDISPEAIEEVDEPMPGVEGVETLRRKDMVELFDTTPDLSGNDIDVSRFIRDTENRDVQVYWRDWDEEEPPDESSPVREELCSVPVHEFQKFVSDKTAWMWNHLDEEYNHVYQRDVLPGKIFLLHSHTGGYREDVGWAPDHEEKVSPVPRGTESETRDATDRDPYSVSRQWVPLSEHLADAESELDDLLDSLGIQEIQDRYRDVLSWAARLHDIGKSHPVFQEAILDLVESDEELDRRSGTLWAKSGVDGFLRYSRKHFRHELASALAVLQTDGLLENLSEKENRLATYLVATHHGKVRGSIRSLPGEDIPPMKDNEEPIRFARGIWEGDELPSIELPNDDVFLGATLDLSPMDIGATGRGISWIGMVSELRNSPEVGSFRLAFLEALVRVADWRASEKEAEI